MSDIPPIAEANPAKKSDGLLIKLLALPPACSIVASLSVIWTLGLVGDWLIAHWLPLTRWFWEATLGRLDWINLTPEQKDILTLTTLMFPIYWTARQQPYVPGVKMNRRRLLALIAAIGIVGLMSRSLFYDAGAFFGGGMSIFVQMYVGILSVILLFLSVMAPVLLYAGLEKMHNTDRMIYRHPSTDRPLSAARSKLYVLTLLVLLCLSVAHFISRAVAIWADGIIVDVWGMGPHVYLPSHPLFIIAMGIVGVFVAKSILGGARLLRRPPKPAKPIQKKAKPRPNKQGDAVTAIIVFGLFFLGGLKTVGMGKTLLLFAFALMIGVIAVRHPKRLINIAWAVGVLLACAVGVQLFQIVLVSLEGAAQVPPA